MHVTDIIIIISVMNQKDPLKRLNQQIEDIKQKLLELGPIHPGSTTNQYHACGNPSCRCHDPANPKKHGPYTKLTYSHDGKSHCRFVRPESAEDLKQRLQNYKTFRDLTAQWVKLAIEAGTLEIFNKKKPSPDSQAKADG